MLSSTTISDVAELVSLTAAVHKAREPFVGSSISRVAKITSLTIASRKETEPFVGCFWADPGFNEAQQQNPLAHWPFRRRAARQLEVSPEVAMGG